MIKYDIITFNSNDNNIDVFLLPEQGHPVPVHPSQCGSCLCDILRLVLVLHPDGDRNFRLFPHLHRCSSRDEEYLQRDDERDGEREQEHKELSAQPSECPVKRLTPDAPSSPRIFPGQFQVQSGQ